MPATYMGRVLYCPECESGDVRFFSYLDKGADMLFVCAVCGEKFTGKEAITGGEVRK
jgi:hypothetical protein